MSTTHKLYGARQRSAGDTLAVLNPTVFNNTLAGYPVLPKGEVQFTAVPDLFHTRPFDDFAELFSPLEDSKLRAPIAGHLAVVLNHFYVWDHVRKSTRQVEAELEQIRKADPYIQTELELFEDGSRE